jgi:alkylation response protein AidB-like acyl-CoA dehydrogenase
MAKLYASEAARGVTDIGPFRIHGGYGYIKTMLWSVFTGTQG